MKVFLIDISICNGCYCCQVVCKDEHVGNDWMPYTRSQPDTGQFWLKLNEYIRGTVPKVKMHYIPVLCMHCDDAPCMNVCPVEGAIYKRDDGLVVIDPEKCNGCRNCIDACPYGAIYFNEEVYLAQKCTGCAHLLDDGWDIPRCVDVCPTHALKFGEESDLKELIDKAVAMNPEAKTKPRVYYMNVPGSFIAGTVFNPDTREVISGATCTLVDTASGETLAKSTDGFGDFWFENLKAGSFSLNIEGDGKTRQIDHIDSANSVNLGNIPLT
ncbi:MAG: 4Fe-4S dicluster domain-containing protein [Dehalococcoidia bacterium]